MKVVHAPYGDFRNWPEISAWALEIAGALTPCRGGSSMSAALGSQVHGPGRVEIGRASGGNYPSWVVCGRKTRDVIGGDCALPRTGAPSAWMSAWGATSW